MTENERNTGITIAIIISIIVIVFFVISGLFGFEMGNGMMGGGMMGMGWLFMFLPIIFIIFLAIALTDRSRTPEYEYPNYVPESPMQALERRYVNGQISREEYLGIKEDILRK